ncbi:sugar phosphate nucleotidyltransferase [Candidatus Marinimicrobia bacterium]|jgi:NDP-sugar pyrophosphorylase family protein|nr:sugar phosphate nucleotidyltransferase [Candidatus Neomarinimicrobiota bacterium]MDC0384176.1 sugar phosphate nucleotidyltransferase [Candidatus Neomarinimicrobiota bacterium]
MKDITLLVMAAGMGSRYGGLKQLESIGPNQETIIDYSIFDAIRAGFTKVVFIIRKDFEMVFKEKISNKFSGKIKVEYAFQDINFLPEGYSCPENREKPWGTAHAILSAQNLINEPFVVINGDDFYGMNTFKVVADYYNNGSDGFSMVSFQLGNTLSSNGSVSRGICNIINDKLETVVETHGLKRSNNQIIGDNQIIVGDAAPVSMNVWGFTPRLFKYLNVMFVDFLEREGTQLKSEYLIPTVVNNLIQSKKEDVFVLNSDEAWFGVTYQEDRDFVMNEILKLIKNNRYPQKIF